ncbi:MAG: hypothetical protein KKF16_03795 [Euryarchaeota archaeon]|nr:hypothetical protein [Euryarchaeota archaeon]MBU4608581.1 hypothetical protein [Euryarchaeota archaeon]MBV1728879.1 hypothetical protein [Methanobacterium sp.]MBV1755208.1 hypothetical protein [Methanobacterium sp.]MBV1767080.1 hypothetical protein [Methanobacterium sp.]
MGSSSKYSYCFAENEEESPWEPLNVERGLLGDSGAVTLLGWKQHIMLMTTAAKMPLIYWIPSYILLLLPVVITAMFQESYWLL